MDHLLPVLRSQTDISAAHLLNMEIETQACGQMIVARSCDDFYVEVELPEKWQGKTVIPVSYEVMSLFAARIELLSHGIVQFQDVRAEIDRIREMVEEELQG